MGEFESKYILGMCMSCLYNWLHNQTDQGKWQQETTLSAPFRWMGRSSAVLRSVHTQLCWLANPYPTASLCVLTLTPPLNYKTYSEFKGSIDLAFTCPGGFGLHLVAITSRHSRGYAYPWEFIEHTARSCSSRGEGCEAGKNCWVKRVDINRQPGTSLFLICRREKPSLNLSWYWTECIRCYYTIVMFCCNVDLIW